MNSLKHFINTHVMIKNTDKIGVLADINNDGTAVIKFYTCCGGIEFYECSQNDISFIESY